MNKLTVYSLIFALLLSLKMFSQAPTNDECAGAINLTEGTQISSSTLTATDSGINSSCSSAPNDVWYKFTAPTAGEVYLYLDGGGQLNYTIYDDCLGTNEVDCGSGGESLVSTLQGGDVYYINIAKSTFPCRGDCDYDFTLTISQNVLSQNEFTIDSFSYYPNPVKDELNINAKHLISKVDIYNMFGEKLKTKNVNSLDTKLNFSNFNSGVYFISVHTGLKNKTIKVIKN